MSGSAGRDPQPTSSAASGKQFQNHHNHHHRGTSRTRYDSLKPNAVDCRSSSSSSGDPLESSTAHHGPLSSSSSGARDNDHYAAAAAAAMGERAGSPPRLSPTGRDYLREMWPMALPPGNVTGNALLVKDAADPADASTFQYGDSVTMTTTATASTAHASRGVAAPTDGGGEYDTHIYATPKYLRREKAATLRLKGAKTRRFDGDGETEEEGDGEKEEEEGRVSSSARRHSAHAHSKTLPRERHLASAAAATGR